MKHLLQMGTIIFLTLAVGCGTKAVDGGSSQVDTVQVTGVVANLNDAVQDPTRFASLWVNPPDAATTAKYKDYLYYASGAPSVSGTTAKIKMKLEKPAGTVAGEPEWEFEKAVDTWKIKAAPLP